MQPIVLATANPHKVAELRAIFAAAGISVIGLNDLPRESLPSDGLREPEETGTTFEANATIKALSYAAQTGRACLADDSGIEIDALARADGTPRPGVISSHYSTDGRETGMSRAERDAANNARVLRELEGVPPERRTARFVCVMVLARPGEVRSTVGTEKDTEGTERGGEGSRRDFCATGCKVIATSRGTFEGRIGIPPRVPAGANGFGYDPLFLVAPEFERTGAELASDEKNRLSHRAMAAKAMIERLHTL
ncbi:MAG: non-canonical purine NTP pyrophosphatase [Phycisphaeraceae bacterium]|nr:non-canonical purine NTP pyrophosphatase [Phycisphaeraceae bacterium]